MHKKLFIFLDGTWNDERGLFDNEIISNIVKLKKSIIENETQLIHYSRGIGNDIENLFVGMVVKGVFALGERKQRHKAMMFLKKNYEFGDNIYIFGFSRGAASSRLLVNDLKIKGIRGITNINIDFLGLLDTVSAFSIPLKILGIKVKNRREKIILNDNLENVKKIVHILSIDENRRLFKPDLIKLREGVEEVWFPGVHSDIGGSYPEEECSIGDKTLKYMIKRLKEFNISNDISPINFSFDSLKKLNNAKELIIHDHNLWFPKYRLVNTRSSNKEAPILHIFSKNLIGRTIRVIYTKNIIKYKKYYPKSFKKLKKYRLVKY